MQARAAVLIVEDENLIAQHLQKILRGLNYDVVGVARRATDALQLLRQGPLPDLVLLDIMLRGEIDGIDLAHRLRAEYQLPFLFVTAFADATTLARATQTHPLGYIVKPFEEKDIYAALEMYWANTETAAVTAPVSAPLSVLAPEPIESLAHDSIFIRHRRQLIKVRFDELLWVEADSNYTLLQTSESKYAVANTLRQVEERLPAADFIRIHKTYVVALRMITALDTHNVTIGNGTLIPLGRTYQPMLMSRLNLLRT